MATKEEREYLSQYVDISGSRLDDSDVRVLMEFIDNGVGKTFTKTSSFDSWSSDGKYTRTEINEYIVESDYSITHNYSYRDDDGQEGEYSQSYSGARDIINILNEVPLLR